MALAFAATAFIDVPWSAIEAKSKGGLVGLRESLVDAIYNISPTDTPFMSMLTASDNSLASWQTDELRPA